MERKLHLLLTLLLLAICTTGGAQTVVFNETFDNNTGEGGNDDKWSNINTLIKPTTDNKGWGFNDYAYTANKCVKLSSSSNSGSATTPSIKLSGDAILTFRAGAWNAKREKTTISLSATNAKLDKTSLTLKKGAFTDYTVNITNVTGNVTIKFYGNSDKNRFFLDEVKVTTVPQGPSFTAATLPSSNFATSGNDSYATFSSDKVTFFPEGDAGVTFTTTVQKAYAVGDMLELTSLATDNATISGNEVSGYFVPANTGVLIKASFDGTTSVPYYTVTGKTVDELTDNMLYPATKAMSDLGDRYYFYKLAYNDYSAKTGLGFYWGADNGAAFKAKTNGAYLAVPKSSTSAKSGFRFDGTTTGVNTINAKTTTNDVIYNIQGQRVGANYKGLVIVNGKKMMRK